MKKKQNNKELAWFDRDEELNQYYFNRRVVAFHKYFSIIELLKLDTDEYLCMKEQLIAEAYYPYSALTFVERCQLRKQQLITITQYIIDKLRGDE